MLKSFPRLGNLRVSGEDYYGSDSVPRPQEPKTSGVVTAHFENLEKAFAEFVSGADLVVGCVAWLTNETVLGALARVPEVSIVVQKEDFLRPDAMRQSKPRLHRLYSALKPPYRPYLPGLAGQLSVCAPDMDAVRCMGYRNGTQRLVMPRMHHKFAVRCSSKPPPGLYAATAVWTGSFNMTYNGSESLENAVIINDEEIAARYLLEWSWVLGMSEPLDWESDWVEPEYRIGT